MVRYRRDLRRQSSSMINVSNALPIVRPVVEVYGDAHGMFASALVTRNVNRILRHGNSRHYLPPWGNVQFKHLSVSQSSLHYPLPSTSYISRKSQAPNPTYRTRAPRPLLNGPRPCRFSLLRRL